MSNSTAAASGAARQAVLGRVRGLAAGLAQRAVAAEDARRLPAESARELLDAGVARILVPRRFGGAALDFETWLDAVVEIAPPVETVFLTSGERVTRRDVLEGIARTRQLVEINP